MFPRFTFVHSPLLYSNTVVFLTKSGDKVAVTVFSHSRLNGYAIKLEIGIKQLFKETNAGKFALQSLVIDEQVRPSSLIILISYPVIVESPSSGKSNKTLTSSKVIVAIDRLGYTSI